MSDCNHEEDDHCFVGCECECTFCLRDRPCECERSECEVRGGTCYWMHIIYQIESSQNKPKEYVELLKRLLKIWEANEFKEESERPKWLTDYMDSYCFDPPETLEELQKKLEGSE